MLEVISFLPVTVSQQEDHLKLDSENRDQKEGGACFALFTKPAKLVHVGPVPWSTRLLNPGEETCSVLVY